MNAPTPHPSAAVDERVTATEIAVIGGGPAGLQAAMTIGRMHRDAIVFDSGEYRNARVEHMHNLAGFDGTAPAEFRALAREQAQAYPTIEFRSDAVVEVQDDAAAGYRLTTATGRVVTARAVVLATGVADTLPAVPGLQELWGTVAAQCPFCHGHENTDRPIAVLEAAAASHLAMFLHRVTDDITVLTQGEPLAHEVRSYLADVGAVVVETPVERFERAEGGADVVLAGGERRFVTGVFTVPTMSQRAPFAQQLDLVLNDSGCVRIDEFGMTSAPGVFAAGDMAHLAAYPMPMASVAVAVAAGQTAAASAIRHVG